MKLNKKAFFLVPIILAILIFLGLFIYFNSEDSNSFTASERKWIKDNVNIRYDIEKISDYPVYTDVFDAFIEKFNKATEMELNVVNYNKSDDTTSKSLRFRIVKEDASLNDKDIVLNEDVYIAIEKAE